MFHLSKKNASRLTHHVDTHSPRCPKVLWPRRFLWHVSPAAKKPAPRRHAIHAFELNIEDHLGTTEVATGNQCHSSSGVGRFCVCVFFRNDLNLKPRDPRPKLKLAKTWKKHGKKRNLFHDFLQGGMLLFCFGGVVIVERIGSHVLFIAVIVLGDWCRAAESKERWVG